MLLSQITIFLTNVTTGYQPITLNQQYLNLYFDDINYLYKHNPSFDELSMNGVCHIADKNKVSHFIRNKNLI